MKKKALSLLLASAMVVSLTACGGGSSNESSSSNSSATDSNASTSTDANASSDASADAASSDSGETTSNYELTELNIVVNGTLTATLDNGQAEFVEQWEKAVGEKLGHDIKLNINQIDHSGYTDAVGRLFASQDYPDAMIMSAEMFKQYAPTGLLWDMADAYANAEFQSRLTLKDINENLKDKDGHLYGFAPTYGNGCVTYVKKAWLDAVGLTVDDIKTYDDYYNMLLKFHNEDPDGNGVTGDTYGVIAAGFLLDNAEAPFINYLPEFWQGAYPSLLQDDSGVWYDGFQTQETKDALVRMHQAYVDGAVDPETLTASTKTAREKWFSNDQTGSSGAFTYWAGTWYQNLTDSLIKNGVDSELVQLPPIQEIKDTWGGYLNREAPVWVIIDDGDGDNSREQAVFDALLDTMLDGDVVETLWVYGAEDVHWSIHAEDFVTNPDDPDTRKEYHYEEGQFHLKQSPNDSNTVWKKNHLDSALLISPLTNGYVDESELMVKGNEFFTANCVDAPVSPSSETFTNESGTIATAKAKAVSSVVVDGADVDEAIATYVSEVGSIVDQCLSELNAAE